MKNQDKNKEYENKEILSAKINQTKEMLLNDITLTANSRAIYQNYRNYIKEGNTEKKLKSAPIQFEMLAINKNE